MSLRKRSSKPYSIRDSGQISVEKPRAREVDPGIRPSQAAFSLLDYSLVLSLVLGGCCAYVPILHADDFGTRSYSITIGMSGLMNNCSTSTHA
jgi:hypothetical protein